MDVFTIGEDPISADAFVAAVVTLWFFVSAGCAASIAVSAIRTQTFAPGLGLDVRGWAASLAGWVTLVVAAALLGAGALVSWVAGQR